MLKRTHFVIGIFVVILFFPHVNNKLIFVPTVLVASLLPNIDHFFTFINKKATIRTSQSFVKLRGVFHSLTLCILISIALALYFPVFAFPFFLGYSLHLLADSWTTDGIKPFWPFQELVRGRVIEGSSLEEGIFFVFVILDFVFLFLLFV